MGIVEFDDMAPYYHIPAIKIALRIRAVCLLGQKRLI
jgi:hypothetical protein